MTTMLIAIYKYMAMFKPRQKISGKFPCYFCKQPILVMGYTNSLGFTQTSNIKDVFKKVATGYCQSCEAVTDFYKQPLCKYKANFFYFPYKNMHIKGHILSKTVNISGKILNKTIDITKPWINLSLNELKKKVDLLNLMG